MKTAEEIINSFPKRTLKLIGRTEQLISISDAQTACEKYAHEHNLINKTVCDNITKRADETVRRCNESHYLWDKEKEELKKQISQLSQPTISVDWDKVQSDHFDWYCEQPAEVTGEMNFNWFKSNIGEQKKESDAVEFVKWIANNCYMSTNHRNWEDRDDKQFTTEELYSLFLKQKDNG